MSEKTKKNNAAQRSRVLVVLVLVFLLAGVGYGAYWWLHSRNFETTDDANVAGNLIRITPRVAGTVVAVYADDTDLVRRGQLLARLDDADARVALAGAEAHLADTVRQVRQMFHAVEQSQANIALKQENLRQAQSDARRRGDAAPDGAVGADAISREEREHADSALKRAQSELRLAESQFEGAQARVARTDPEHHPAVRQAAAQVREAFLNLERCAILAPESGYVAKRVVQLGQQIAPGTALMVVVPLRQVWVEANFKEDQLKRMRIGQAVEMKSDLYGSSVVHHGKVVGLAAGTGSVFSLLPPQNASGNWIKIVQRLPVRVALDPADLAKYPLRIGLSMKAEVETRDASGESLARVAPTGPRYETDVYVDDEKAAERRIAEIVFANLGRRGGT